MRSRGDAAWLLTENPSCQDSEAVVGALQPPSSDPKLLQMLPSPLHGGLGQAIRVAAVTGQRKLPEQCLSIDFGD